MLIKDQRRSLNLGIDLCIEPCVTISLVGAETEVESTGKTAPQCLTPNVLKQQRAHV